MSKQLDDINKALQCPEELVAKDGRKFYVQSWAPVADYQKEPGVVKVTAQMLVKVGDEWGVSRGEDGPT